MTRKIMGRMLTETDDEMAGTGELDFCCTLSENPAAFSRGEKGPSVAIGSGAPRAMAENGLIFA